MHLARKAGVLGLLLQLVAVVAYGAEPSAAADGVALGEVGPAFDADAATAEYLARQTPEEKARSDGYFEGGYWLDLWSFLLGLGVAWWLLRGGFSRRMKLLAERITRRRPLQTAIYAAQYVLLTTILFLPWTIYRDFFREHQYGLSTQSIGEWASDRVKGTLVTLILVSVLLVVLYAVFRRAPRAWWLWGTVVAMVFLVFTILIAPVYVDPLFNEYTPLAPGEARDEILSLARASGIEGGDVYQFDASRQSTRISANVSGFLNTMSIRLNDILLNRTSLPEIKAVMGHEIGHYALNHIYEGLIFFGLVLAGAFAFLRWGFDRVVARWGSSWGISGIADVTGLPLLVALTSVYFFALTPIVNTYIRVNEAEADLYGLHTAHEPDGFAEVALKLGEYRKLDPGPLEEWIFFDHPSGRARIEMAMNWKAEHLNH